MNELAKIVSKIQKFRGLILSKRENTSLFQRSLKDVKHVVIINASSRSLSSLLYTLLCKLPGVYALSGEAIPFYKLNTDPERCNLFESDKIPSAILDSAVDVQGLSRDFLTDMKHVRAGILTSEIDAEEYADDLMLRFPLEWTDVDFDYSVLRACINTALERYIAKKTVFQTAEFYLDLLAEIIKMHPVVNPFYYDISTEKAAFHFPSVKVPSGPPNLLFNVEEPPFILIAPYTKATPEDLAENTLLLKSSVDCYRMNLIESILPNADMRIIQLTRNPAATTNGICDGWLHRGFFSHNLQPYFDGCSDLNELRIKGYSDIFPFGRYWWNFDLPEGWQGVVEKDLIDVCAFQWYSANMEIEQYLSRRNKRFLTVHAENIIRDIGSRIREFENILSFMDIPLNQMPLLELVSLQVVQSTQPPQLYRWKKRPEILPKLLGDPRIIALADRLGYDRGNIAEWL